MKITLTLHDLSAEHAEAVLDAAAKITAGVKNGGGVLEKPAATGKKKPPVVEDNFIEDDDKGEDDDTEEKALAVEDVIEGLQKYAEENSRDEAKKILAKFKVKSVHDLKKSDYPKILKLLA